MDLGRKVGGLIIVAGSVIPMVTIAADEVIEVYPTRPIRLVLGSPPGGGADFMARHIAKSMAEELGQRVVIENRPGAAGNIGAAAVAKAAADGYTIYLATRPVALHKTMYKDIKYDFAQDLIPVGMVATVPFVLVAGKHVSVSTFVEAIALTRKHPSRFTCGWVGLGSTPHLLYEQMRGLMDISWMTIPYKGAAQALRDVVGEDLDFSIVSVASALPLIKSGAIRALLLFSDGDVPALASVPNIKESGLADMQGEAWYALVAPAGTPQHAIARLNRALNVAISSPQIRQALIESGHVLPSARNTPEMLGTFFEEDTSKWTAILEAQQVKGLQ